MGLAGNSFETDAHHDGSGGGSGDRLFRVGRQRPAETDGQKFQSPSFLRGIRYQSRPSEYNGTLIEGGQPSRQHPGVRHGAKGDPLFMGDVLQLM